MPSNIAEATVFELRLIQEICEMKSLEFKYMDDLKRYKNLAQSSHGESTNEKLQIQENRLKNGLPIFVNELNQITSKLETELADITWTGRDGIGERVADLELNFLNSKKIPISIKSGGPGTERNLGGRSLKKILDYNSNSTLEKMLKEVVRALTNEIKGINLDLSWRNLRKIIDQQDNSEHLRAVAATIGKTYQNKFSLEIKSAWDKSTDSQKMELLKFLSLQNDPRDIGLKIFVAEDNCAYFKNTLNIKKIKSNNLEIEINDRSEKGTLDFFIFEDPYWRLNVNFTNGLGLSPLAVRVFLI